MDVLSAPRREEQRRPPDQEIESTCATRAARIAHVHAEVCDDGPTVWVLVEAQADIPGRMIQWLWGRRSELEVEARYGWLEAF